MVSKTWCVDRGAEEAGSGLGGSLVGGDIIRASRRDAREGWRKKGGIRLHLEVGDTRVEIDEDWGGRISSLRIAGAEVLATDRQSPVHWGSFVMAPWAGRVRDGCFVFEGRRHDLPRRLPPHAIHGTILDRGVDVEEVGPSSCRMTAQLGPDWPWEGKVVQTVALAASRLSSRLELHASDRTFPGSIGWHPWFRRDLGVGGSLELEFEAALQYERDASGIPTGETLPPRPGPHDDCFCRVLRGPVLKWPGALEISLSSTLDHWVIYDEPRDTICVEPQSGPPDALNLCPALVEPGAPLVGEFLMDWT